MAGYRADIVLTLGALSRHLNSSGPGPGSKRHHGSSGRRHRFALERCGHCGWSGVSARRSGVARTCTAGIRNSPSVGVATVRLDGCLQSALPSLRHDYLLRFGRGWSPAGLGAGAAIWPRAGDSYGRRTLPRVNSGHIGLACLEPSVAARQPETALGFGRGPPSVVVLEDSNG